MDNIFEIFKKYEDNAESILQALKNVIEENFNMAYAIYPLPFITADGSLYCILFSKIILHIRKKGILEQKTIPTYYILRISIN